MKRLLLSAFAAIAACSLHAQDVVVVDGIKYSLNSFDPIYGATAIVEAYDQYGDYENNGLYYVGDISIPSQISYDGTSYTVTSISPSAFLKCRQLTSIVIPSTVSSLGASTFAFCEKLESVTMHDKLQLLGSELFMGCTSLKNIEIPSATTKIPNNAFEDCTSLEHVTFLGKVKSIGTNAFFNTPELRDISLPSTVTSLGANAFSGTNTSKIIRIAASAVPTTDSSASEYGEMASSPFQDNVTIIVPTASLSEYIAAWPSLEYNLVPDAETSYTVTVSALENESNLLQKITEGRDKSQALYVVDLKVSGTINSHDILGIRNKMLNLHNLDLSEANIVANDYPYYQEYGTKDNEVSERMFYNLNKLTTIKLPKSATVIGRASLFCCGALIEVEFPENLISIESNAFDLCCSLKAINLPTKLKEIGSGAFENCASLKSVIIPPSVKTLSYACFYNCPSLETIDLPTGLKEIEGGAFACAGLKTVKLPSSIVTIEDNAFSNCPLSDIYTWTIIPITINQETFSGGNVFTTAKIHVPETSEDIYYKHTQWGLFQKIESFNEPYTYFYLDNADLWIEEETPRIEGEEVDGEIVNPDAEFGSGAGLVVQGDDSQYLGEVSTDATSAIIGGDSGTSDSGDNINIDRLVINIDITKDRWYFFCFPFDVPKANIQFNGQFEWCYYDGEYRAEHGSGAWRTAEGNLNANQGYIFIGSKDGVLKISVENVSIGAADQMIALESYPSSSSDDASWSLVGNPYTSYYNLADLGYSAPITFWNPETQTYEAYSPQDDDIVLYPYQAFFVQKPDECDGVEFDSEHRETAQQAGDSSNQQAAKMRRLARVSSNENRMICNLELNDGNIADKTRVVFNDAKSIGYEIGCDASKFLSDRASQLYTLDNANVRYAINERPTSEGIVRMGFIAIADGSYTISATRLDTPLYLLDLDTGASIDLATDSYAFDAQSGMHNHRFVLSTTPDLTSASAIAAEAAAAEYYDLKGINRGHDMPTGLSISSKGEKIIKK